MQMRLGARESVRRFVRCAYFEGGAYDEDWRFFFLEGERETVEAGSVALRFREVARDAACRVGEEIASAES